MIPVPTGVQVWLATGHTDMRQGFNGLALLVQETFKRDPHGGHLFVFRGRRGGLIKILWHDGQGMCLFAKRLERGRFIWPSPADGAVAITPAQLGYLLEGIDWRHPAKNVAPASGGLIARFERRMIVAAREPELVIPSLMSTDDSLPDDVETLKALLLAGQCRTHGRGSEGAQCRSAGPRALALLIEKMKFKIAKLRHEQYGQSSERRALIEQLELELAELEETAAEGEATARLAAARRDTDGRRARIRATKPARRPLPSICRGSASWIRRRQPCPCCGGNKLRKIGEDVTETLEAVPRQWKVIQHVREKFSCRACEKISQPPAPSHPIARGRAGPDLLAMSCSPNTACICRSTGRARPMPMKASSSTSRRWPIGSAPAAATLTPLVEAIKAHVFAAERIHADDTTVPVLAKGKCARAASVDLCPRRSAVRRHASAGGGVLLLARPRRQPSATRIWRAMPGLMQADAYAGFNQALRAVRKPGPIIEAACWAHARRKFFDLARLKKSPIAIEAIKRIDVLFAIEREINGLPPEQRRAVRQERSRPLVAELESFLRERTPSSRPRARPPRPSTTASSAGRRSPASSTTAGCA